MIDLLFVAFIIYIVYQLVFNFIVPVSKTASQVRNKMYETNEQQKSSANAASANFSGTKTNTQQAKKQTGKHSDEYIDFEEVK